MSNISEKLQAVLQAKGDIKNAIEQKGVTVGSTPLSGYAQKILDIPSGGGEDEPYTDDAVRFFDYDGTQLLGMSKEDFLTLDAMPANPATHEGLVFTEWTHTLAEAQNYVSKYDYCDVMALYDTVDGKTRVTIRVDAGDELLVYFFGWPCEIRVDWGDGQQETITGAANTIIATHIYTNAGDYTVIFDVISGRLGSGNTLFGFATDDYSYVQNNANKVLSFCYGNKGTNNLVALKGRKLLYHTGVQFTSQSNQGVEPLSIKAIYVHANIYNAYTGARNARCVVIKDTLTTLGTYSLRYLSKVDRILLPSNMTTIGGSLAAYCYNAKHIVIPDNITTISSEAFSLCYSVKEIKIPELVTSIGDYAFRNCSSARSIELSEELTTIGNYAFIGCDSINEITIPSKVTSIGTNAFYSRSPLNKLINVYVKPTTPPTLGSNVFLANTTFTIHVPQGSLATYQAATNWSAYAQYMVDDITE